MAASAPSGWRRIDFVFLLILVSALGVRLYLGFTQECIHDEENNAIPLAHTISFSPATLHLPMRGENHGALPAYIVKASSSLFGTTPLGYRALHVTLGLLTIVIVFLLTREWYGPVAARWAGALLAFNEYFLPISARATAHVPNLFLVAAAIYAFSRFLRSERPAYLYLAGASVGLAFYCKELSALLLPVFLVTLLRARYRHWLRRPHPYLACALFVLLIGPDLYWNVTTDPETAMVHYDREPQRQATYRKHLQRIGGLGFSPYPSMFYARGPVKALYLRMTGQELTDETAEYHSMNPAVGVLLLGAVIVTTLRRATGGDLRVFLLVLFWVIFGLFTLIKKGRPEGRLDPVSWMWVEITMLPAIVLAGARLADTTGKSRTAAWTFSGAALLYAAWMVVSAVMSRPQDGCL